MFKVFSRSMDPSLSDSKPHFLSIKKGHLFPDCFGNRRFRSWTYTR